MEVPPVLEGPGAIARRSVAAVSQSPRGRHCWRVSSKLGQRPPKNETLLLGGCPLQANRGPFAAPLASSVLAAGCTGNMLSFRLVQACSSQASSTPLLFPGSRIKC